MKRQTFQNSVLIEEWDTDTRLYTRWNAQGVQQEQRPFTPAENQAADEALAAEAAQANVDTRTANILAAVAQLNSYAATAFQREDQARNTPSLRTATAWNQSQRVAVLDTIADLCHAVGVLCNDVKWLGQQALGSTDDPDE